MRISFKTLGCRLNQHEIDALVSGFDTAGFDIVYFKDTSDVTIINTCTVTRQSDHKSRNIIMQAIKANPESQIVVTGCMAQQYKKELEKIPGVSLVVSNDEKSNIISLVKQKISNAVPVNSQINNVFNYQPIKKSLHTRVAIKIQDGCDNYCTFCIIPQVRGRAISRPTEDIIKSITQTLKNGFKEIVITGVNIGRYYYKGIRFVALIKKILEIPGDFRVRISSLEPDGFGDELIDLFANNKLAPHLHLCLQSGSDPILLKMRRMYSIDQYIALVSKIKNRYPNFNITTDIIVGFPGESDSYFEDTKNIIKKLKFSHIHTFKYSRRTGTYADRMNNQIDDRVKTQRSEIIREISENNKTEYYKTFINKTERVLVEKHLGNDRYLGYGEHYIPITFKHSENIKNEFVNIEITGIDTGKDLVLKGSIISSKVIENKLSISK